MVFKIDKTWFVKKRLKVKILHWKIILKNSHCKDLFFFSKKLLVIAKNIYILKNLSLLVLEEIFKKIHICSSKRLFYKNPRLKNIRLRHTIFYLAIYSLFGAQLTWNRTKIFQILTGFILGLGKLTLQSFVSIEQ